MYNIFKFFREGIVVVTDLKESNEKSADDAFEISCLKNGRYFGLLKKE